MKKSILKLTAIATSIVLTIAVLAAYHGVFAQNIGGQPEQKKPANAEASIDSVAYNKGLAELQQIIDHYKTSSVQVDGEIRYYRGDSSTVTPTEKARFVFAVDGERSLYELDSVVTVGDNNVALVVDKREESIAVIEKSEMEIQSQQVAQPAADMLSEMKGFIKDIRLSNSGQQSQLTLFFKDDAPSNVTQYVIVYDAQTYAIKKMRIVMADAELEDTMEAGEAGTLSEDDELYFVDSSNNAIPTGMYAKANTAVYEIVYGQERKLQKDAISIFQYVKKTDEVYVPVGKYKNYSILN
jgi:hypothetical protein